MDKYNESGLDHDYYGTGPTRPPKNYSAVIAIALILLVIYIGGFSTAGRLNATRDKAAATDPTISAKVETASAETAAAEAEAPMIAASQPSPTTDARYQMNLSASPASVENIPQAGGLSLQEIYVKAIDSVVSITSAGHYSNSTGTGVVLSEDGYIVTNCHVVEGGSQYTVLLNDGREYDALLIGTDTVSDLAVLQIDADYLVPAEFGDSNVLRVGDSVAAIGDPLGISLRGTMTDGIISAINRDVVTGGRTMTLIQTNAALNEGNSGGPLLNCYGQVIGINTMKMESSYYSGSVEGLGFAIPSTTVKEIVDQLTTQGYVSGRPELGFRVEDVTSFYQFYYRLPSGVYISELPENSNGAAAGLKMGDIIVYLGSERVRSTDQIRTLLYGMQAGDAVEVTVYRDGEQLTVTLILAQATG